MNFSDAAAISATGLPVRRTGWSDATQWFTCWRGLWWYQDGTVSRPVAATDYNSADLLATDWTTVPASLAACPVDPTIGSTGGAPPTPGTPGFAGSATSGSPGATGSSGGGGSGGGPLPPPNPGTSLRVTFIGVAPTGTTGDVPYSLTIGSYLIPSSGPNVWWNRFTAGSIGSPPNGQFILTLSAVRDDDVFTVTLSTQSWDNGSIGEFSTLEPEPRGVPIENNIDPGVDYYGGGTALVS